MHRQLVEHDRVHPVERRRLVAGPRRTGQQQAAVLDGELLADLPVVVGDDMSGIRVHPDDVDGLDLEAGLLENLASGGLPQGLADFHRPPPGKAQYPLSERRIMSTRPSSSWTKTEAAGTTLGGVGAAGSS